MELSETHHLPRTDWGGCVQATQSGQEFYVSSSFS